MGLALLGSLDLTDRQFDEISNIVHEMCGINLHDGKKELVKARLTKRLRAINLRSFKEYMEYVRGDATGAELTAMLDALSTNLTSFFREVSHFDHLADGVVPQLVAGRARRVRIWSAGCSSGEEPYTIAMTLSESIPDLSLWDAKILATDLSTAMLAKAQEGVYPAEKVESVPAKFRAKYFERLQKDPSRAYRSGS